MLNLKRGSKYLAKKRAKIMRRNKMKVIWMLDLDNFET